ALEENPRGTPEGSDAAQAQVPDRVGTTAQGDVPDQGLQTVAGDDRRGAAAGGAVPGLRAETTGAGVRWFRHGDPGRPPALTRGANQLRGRRLGTHRRGVPYWSQQEATDGSARRSRR